MFGGAKKRQPLWVGDAGSSTQSAVVDSRRVRAVEFVNDEFVDLQPPADVSSDVSDVHDYGADLVPSALLCHVELHVGLLV